MLTQSELAMLKEAINTLMAIDTGITPIAHREHNIQLMLACIEINKACLSIREGAKEVQDAGLDK